MKVQSDDQGVTVTMSRDEAEKVRHVLEAATALLDGFEWEAGGRVQRLSPSDEWERDSLRVSEGLAGLLPEVGDVPPR